MVGKRVNEMKLPYELCSDREREERRKAIVRLVMSCKYGHIYDADNTLLKLSIANIAKTIGVPVGTVYNWMHGLRIPRAAAMDEICRVLMCTRADLMDNPAQPTIPPQAVQEPAGANADRDPELVLAALDSAGYGHLRELFEAVKDADQGTVDRITNMVKILQPR